MSLLNLNTCVSYGLRSGLLTIPKQQPSPQDAAKVAAAKLKRRILMQRLRAERRGGDVSGFPKRQQRRSESR